MIEAHGKAQLTCSCMYAFIIMLYGTNQRLAKERQMPVLSHCSSLWCNEKLRLHIKLAEFRDTPSQLQICLHSFQNPHMREADLLDELELGVLGQRWNGLCDFEHSGYDIVGRVAEIPACMLVGAA